MTPGPQSLQIILERCGITLDGVRLEKLWRYHQMLRRANAKLNLTRIHNFENMVVKHYADSLLVLKYIELPAPLVDMGSGAGLPGIPLKIARPDISIILAEPRAARVGFLREVCESLALKEIDVYPHKLGMDYPGQVGGVISRAVGSIPETLDRVVSCLAPGGRMIFMKGPGCDDEVTEAARAHSARFRLAADRAYTIAGTPHHRRLVVYERTGAEPADRSSERDDGARAAAAGARAAAAGARAAAAGARAAAAGAIREITSASNPTFQRCSDLLTGPGIRKHAQAIVAGARIRSEVLARFSQHVRGWLTGPSGPEPPDGSISWYRFSDSLFKQLDVVGTHGPLLLVEVPPIPAWSDDQPWPVGCTLFVPFQDPENVGAVVRSAAAFGVARVVLLREAAHPFHPRSVRAAGPALFQVPLLLGPPLEELDVRAVPLVALDTSGPELSETTFPERFGLVVGAEGPGLPPRLRQGQGRRIAIEPGVDSLNAATAAAIALYIWAKNR